MLQTCWCFLILFVVVRVTKAYSYSDSSYSSGEAGKILLSVYYESNCSDTRSFIKRQLQPTIHALRDRISLKLVPFGKAKSLNFGRSGFVCQHGPNECLGNVVQDCTLDLMRYHSDANVVDYVACEMDTLAGTRNDMTCVSRAGVNPDLVRNCVSGQHGIRLQLDSEYQTSLVQHSFIPTITMNDVYNPKFQSDALRDLYGTLYAILQYNRRI